MLRFWRNPEFMRHVRAELRPARALTTGVLVLVICTLVGLPCWANERQNVRQFSRTFYAWLMGIQYLLVIVWCTSTCGQAISRERELKTYDFLKTTRLTAGEITLGKILGAPIIAYFAVACSLPVSLLAGILGGFSLGVIFATYALMAVTALFASIAALWISMLLEKATAGAVGLLMLIPLATGFVFAFSPFPGFGGISIFPALFSLYGLREFEIVRIVPTLFGLRVPFLFLTVLLYVLFGAWFVLMLTRNLKRDREEIRLLSRWQAVGFAVFLNLLFYAFLDPKRVGVGTYEGLSPAEVSALAMALNGVVLFLIGTASLSPQEKLKIWYRKYAAREEAYFAEHGLPWPWLVPAAVMAYALLAAEAAGSRPAKNLGEWQLGAAGLQLLVVLVFVTRDVLFLQWCNLTRMKGPVVKGFLYLLLYYTSVGILGAVVEGVFSKGQYVLGVLGPFYVFAAPAVTPRSSPEIYVGIALQAGAVFLLLNAISNRLRRPAIVPAASAA